MKDHIKVHGLSTTTLLSESPWPTIDAFLKPVSQPVIISLDIEHDIQAASRSDDLTRSVNYSAISKIALSACNPDSSSSTSPALTAYGLAERIIEHCLAGLDQPVSRLGIELELPKAVLRARSAGVMISRRKDRTLADRHKFYVKELPVHTIVGIHPHEREDKQPVFISLELVHAADLEKDFKLNFSKLERRISNFVEASSYLTVEALASEICRETLEWLDDPAPFFVTVSLKKPAALRTADGPEILITRSISDFSSRGASSSKSTAGKTFATLALGANIGDRFQNIEHALRHLENFQPLWPSDAPSGEIDVIDTSFMYETVPMYVVSQPPFINCACLVETTLTALELLKVCKQIEKAVGRVPSVRFGPRAVDLDIVTFGDQVIDTRAPDDRISLDNLEGQLVVPHPRLTEREFVLRPLRDIIPEWVHPELHLSVRSLLAKLLLSKAPDEPPMHKAMPFPEFQRQRPLPAGVKPPATQTYWTLPDPHTVSSSSKAPNRRVYTMATLNVTPDSFSDGSKHNALETALGYARESVNAGAAIIDVGGYSTRPGAAFVSQSEEISRISLAIQAIRNDADVHLRNIPISIDTFRAEVARAAIEAGANCINDVYAFSGPQYPPSPASETHFSEMQAVAHEFRVPVVMMHSRGEAGSNKDYSLYDAAGQGRAVLEGVRTELGMKVFKATKGQGGLRRWQVMVDPGVGFSKTVDGNLEILRNASMLTADSIVPPFTDSFNIDLKKLPYTTPHWNSLAGYPLLIGTSRKSFLGSIISQPFPPASSEEPGSGYVPNSERPSKMRPASERDFATAVAVACAIQQGTAVVRVHAVSEMTDVVKVASIL